MMKFLAVKFVIFFSFWQAVFLATLGSTGVLRETEYFTVSNISSQVNNFIICIEMVIAAVVHIYCFHADEYEGERTNVVHGIRDIVIPVDLVHDTKKAIQLKKKNKTAAVELQPIKTVSDRPVLRNGWLRTQNSNVGTEQFEPDAPLIISNGGETDLGEGRELGRSRSIDTNPDMEVDEIDEEMEGVGIIRLNPRVNFEISKYDSSMNSLPNLSGKPGNLSNTK
jgi:hypothetical protein